MAIIIVDFSSRSEKRSADEGRCRRILQKKILAKFSSGEDSPTLKSKL